MPRPHRPIRAVAVLLATLAGLAGLTACSGSSSDPDRSSAPTTTSTAPAADATSTPQEVPAEPSAGCGTEADLERIGAEDPGDVEATFDSNGTERIYRLGIPDAYDPAVPAPLLVNLHGSGSNAFQASIYGDVPRRAAERGFLTVAPQGFDGLWELPDTGADADFLRMLVDDVEARYCVDRNRIHIIGMSLGAWKAAATACAEPDRYASAALVTVEVYPGGCSLPVVAFHGTADGVVAYGPGGGTVDDAETPNAGLPGTLANMAGWSTGGGCGDEATVTPIGNDVEHRVWPGCDEGVDVELYTVLGGGHTWPGSAIEIGPTTQTIDATALALDHFEAHPRRSTGR